MKKFSIPDPPYVQAHHVNSKHRPTAIMLSLSWTTSDQKAALGIAGALHQVNAPVNSYHYMLDEAETYRGVWDNLGAAGTPHGALDVLMCGQPCEDVYGWADPPASRVYQRTVDLVADLVLAYGIKVRYLDEELEARWKKHRWRSRGGILLNVKGAWPHETFLSRVRLRIDQKSKEQ
jgi:hypothetical protein